MPNASKAGRLRGRNARPRTPEETQQREVARDVVADVRRGQAVTKAARARGIDLATVFRFAGSEFQRTSSGRYVATPFDRISRTVSVVTPQGPEWIPVRDSRTRSRISEHRNAVKNWRHTRDVDLLKPYKGLSFRAGGKTYRFVTDPQTLNRLDDADLLALETLYRSVQAGSV
jgi:hypothetical protein